MGRFELGRKPMWVVLGIVGVVVFFAIIGAYL